MSPKDAVAFLALAAIWGASFLFMRVTAPLFGPVPLMLLRCAVGAATLVPMLLLFGRPADLRANASRIAIVGVLNSAVPFVLLGYATLTLDAGVTSIMNSLAPLWSAGVAFLWLGDRLTRLQVLGLCLGVAGVIVLAGGDVSAETRGAGEIAPPFVAALGATAFYGLGANYARRFLSGVDPLALATGSQVSATLALLVPGLLLWPESSAPGAGVVGWGSVLALGTVCTGFAYLLFFHLIGSVGATRTIAVTFVIPVFGVGWGAWLLDERVDGATLLGGAVIVLGTALTTRVLAARRRAARAS